MSCVLCDSDGGQLVWRGDKLRVIRADEAGFPAFYRVIWNTHVAEFSDLSAAERAHCMQAVGYDHQDQPRRPGQRRAAPALACDRAL